MIKRSKATARRRGAREGATAVEFAMIAAPLMLLIFATIELALVFVVATVSESALAKAAREIRTGQQQTGADVTEGAFKARACEEMMFLEDHCTTHFEVDVRTIGQFTRDGAPDPAAGGGFDDSQLTFQPGGPNAIVLVRGFYQWPLLTPFLDQALGDVNGTTALIISAETFRNEPYA